MATYVGSGAGSSLPLANTFPMLTMRDAGGAAGIAYKGTVCGSRNYRVNINEYYGDIDTAQVIRDHILLLIVPFQYCGNLTFSRFLSMRLDTT